MTVRVKKEIAGVQADDSISLGSGCGLSKVGDVLAEEGVKWKKVQWFPLVAVALIKCRFLLTSPHIRGWMQEGLGIMRRKKGVIRGFGGSSFNYILAATGFIVSSRLNLVGKALGMKCMFMLGCLPVASYKINLTCSDTSIETTKVLLADNSCVIASEFRE